MDKQDVTDFAEAFLTVLFAGGAAHGAISGTTFPGLWPLSVEFFPVVGLATLAGIRRVNAGRRNDLPPALSPPGPK